MTLLDRLVGSLAGMSRTPAQRRAERLAEQLRTLISERGEASGAALALRALDAYRELDDAGRLHFFALLAQDFSPDRDAVAAASTSPPCNA
jgi:malonyl-CoA decarboxylase